MSIRRYAVIGVLALLIVAGAVSLVFAQGENSDLIHACVNNGSGTGVEPGVECGSNEVPLDWSPDGAVNTSGNTTQQVKGFEPFPTTTFNTLPYPPPATPTPFLYPDDFLPYMRK